MHDTTARKLYACGLGVLARAYRTASERVPQTLRESVPIDQRSGPDWQACDTAELNNPKARELSLVLNCIWFAGIASTITEQAKTALNTEAGRYLDSVNGRATVSSDKLLFNPTFALESQIIHIMMRRLALIA
jgi:hypothetical protein